MSHSGKARFIVAAFVLSYVSRMATPLTHSEVRLSDPDGWVLRIAHHQAKRLVVFVHGFLGNVVGTWQQFPEVAAVREWWREADLLFVGYRSRTDGISGAAARLRRHLPRFFPLLPTEYLTAGNAAVRDVSVRPYTELVLVGHSLGGLLIRRVLSDMAVDWRLNGFVEPAPPVLRAARSVMFSPASAGFRPAGMFGLFHASPAWWLVELLLRQPSTLTDIRPGSAFLADTRTRTEDLVRERPDLMALRAQILWANPDNYVVTERYHTDHLDDSADGRSHRSVCKPAPNFQLPVDIVEGVA